MKIVDDYVKPRTVTISADELIRIAGELEASALVLGAVSPACSIYAEVFRRLAKRLMEGLR